MQPKQGPDLYDVVDAVTVILEDMGAYIPARTQAALAAAELGDGRKVQVINRDQEILDGLS